MVCAKIDRDALFFSGPLETAFLELTLSSQASPYTQHLGNKCLKMLNSEKLDHFWFRRSFRNALRHRFGCKHIEIEYFSASSLLIWVYLE